MFTVDIGLMICDALKRYSINNNLLEILHGKTSELKNTDILNVSTNSAKICSFSEKTPQFSQNITI